MNAPCAATTDLPNAARPLRDAAPALARLFRAADRWLKSMALDERSRHVATAPNHENPVRREHDGAVCSRPPGAITMAP